MFTLKNSDVYINGVPFAQTSAGRAINDILSQKINSRLGLHLRKLLRQLQAQAEDVQEEVKRLIEQFEQDENGKFSDKDQKVLDEQYSALLADTFDVNGEPITIKSLDGLNLSGWTWVSPIVEELPDEDEPSDEAKEKAE